MANNIETNIQTNIEVDFENRNKATVFFRGILAAPVFVFIWSLGSFSESYLAPLLAAPVALALIVRQVYPSYLLSFNHAMLEIQARVGTYLLCLTDEYPSIERNPRVVVVFPEIEGGRTLNRWMPLIKWFLAIPLIIVGFVYIVIALVVSVIAWVITWSTGKYPLWAADTVVGTMKYINRVYGYAFVLVTDEYPSFSLKA
jgi:hypothetical protein